MDAVLRTSRKQLYGERPSTFRRSSPLLSYGEHKRVRRIPCDASRKRVCWHRTGRFDSRSFAAALRMIGGAAGYIASARGDNLNGGISRWQLKREAYDRPPPAGALPPSRHRNVSRETFVLTPLFGAYPPSNLPFPPRFRAVFTHMLRYLRHRGRNEATRRRATWENAPDRKGTGPQGAWIRNMWVKTAHRRRAGDAVARSITRRARRRGGIRTFSFVRHPRALCVLHAGETRRQFRARVE